jgi:hypothetical protein
MRERMLARPVPADPLALLLDWSPQALSPVRAISASRPGLIRCAISATRAPDALRLFLSVWKRRNGVWRVALDAGVSTPGAPQPETLAIAAGATQDRSRLIPTGAGPAAARMRLVALEREARSLDPDPADTPSYFELLANSVRVLREGSYALIGADAAHKALCRDGRRVF